MNLPLPVAVALMLGLAALALVGMRVGWRHRVRRTAAILPDALPVGPADPGTARTGPLPAVYVSTTTAGDWLDRLASHGLGERSRSTVQVFDAGVVIRRPSSTDVFVPAADLLSARLDRGMAGKYVGREGLVVLRWRLGDVPVDTGLRTDRSADRTLLHDALTRLASPHAPITEEIP